ncbi:fasciclin-1 isoform X3 [Halyomorpha halys]|uniref:fasciclin-1 isoform X3 n=1 Tax=Halyomorpha halys TaxID=286706 RepID=UPI0034D237A3
MGLCLLFVLSFFTVVSARHNYTIDQKIRDDSDLSQFYSLLERDRVAKSTLEYRAVTIFAPLNFAFQKFKGKPDESLVLYHITNSAHKLNQLGYTVSSEYEGNPPLWVSRVRYENKDEVYINNARVVQQRSNFVQNNNLGKKQVLHILEGVLEPVRFTSPEMPIYNPNAYEFMNYSESLDLENHRIRSFRHRVNYNNKQNVFTAEGKFTFFIPVDEGFQIKRQLNHTYDQPPPRPDKIDDKVIDGHVIPDKVLFTAPTEDGQEFETLSYTDTLKVTISFSTEKDGKEIRKYVKSHTIVGDQQHPNGVVLAEIVKANIPVRNGVVHLIHRPLMVVDTTVTQFLEDREDGPLYKLYEVIRDTDGDFMERLTRMRELTLFAPSNAAWRDPSLNLIMRDRNRIRDILHMHLVEEKLPMETIIYKNINQLFQAPTLTPRKNLYFNVINVGGNKTLTVEGGGVNATVIQPDIAAINGIVHIIDRVLGVAHTTVGKKLAADPMLNKTYQMGKAQGFNNQLDDMNKRFTYFVPRDYAWKKLETRNPSAHKKLFMHEYAYHLLERHLVVADKSFTISELANMTQHEAKQLPTVRDVVKFKVKENQRNEMNETKGFYIEWNNDWIHVFRPDVECTNGVIHVIDKVLLKDSDIYVTGSGYHLHPTFGFVFCLLLSRYL